MSLPLLQCRRYCQYFCLTPDKKVDLCYSQEKPVKDLGGRIGASIKGQLCVHMYLYCTLDCTVVSWAAWALTPFHSLYNFPTNVSKLFWNLLPSNLSLDDSLPNYDNRAIMRIRRLYPVMFFTYSKVTFTKVFNICKIFDRCFCHLHLTPPN